jgi:hypothetical protein
MKWLARIYHGVGGLATLAVIGLLLGIIYLPRFFQSPEEQSHSALRDCDWAIQSNLSRNEKCDAFATLYEKNRLTYSRKIADTGSFTLAKYNYLRGEVVTAKQYCVESIAAWRKRRDSNTGESDWAKAARQNATDHIDQCEKMLLQHH